MYFVGVSLAESFIYGLVLGWSFEFLLWVHILLCILFVFYWKLSEALRKMLGKWLNKSKLISKPLPDLSASSHCRYVRTQTSALYFITHTTTFFYFHLRWKRKQFVLFLRTSSIRMLIDVTETTVSLFWSKPSETEEPPYFPKSLGFFFPIRFLFVQEVS